MRFLFHSSVPNGALTVEPVSAPFPNIEGAAIAADFLGKRVAGDFYDALRVSPERVLFGLLDVAGRREDNRGILAAAQEIFRNVGTELFSRPDINESDAMTELSLRINRGLIETSHGVHSCPAFIGCYHEKFGTLCYANAGHTPGLLCDRSGIAELGSTGLPLGLFSHVTSDAPTIGLEQGAALLLVSRGVIECEGRPEQSNEEFGLERVKQLFQAAPTGGAQALCASILSSVADFGVESLQCDDRTALALVRTA
ncbi:MAG: PP2C family protein-serine/threonine phosphatase [Candidatus Sulfotelmatobacter sp.]|jgi:serine phosphatase RsbU (regulator of sigma subunit)